MSCPVFLQGTQLLMKPEDGRSVLRAVVTVGSGDRGQHRQCPGRQVPVVPVPGTGEDLLGEPARLVGPVDGGALDRDVEPDAVEVVSEPDPSRPLDSLVDRP